VKGDVFEYSYNILNMWRNYFCQLLNEQRVSDVKQSEIHTVESLAPEPRPFKVKMATKNLKALNRQVLVKFRENLLKQKMKH
jgi:hypothetical protein